MSLEGGGAPLLSIHYAMRSL